MSPGLAAYEARQLTLYHALLNIFHILKATDTGKKCFLQYFLWLSKCIETVAPGTHVEWRTFFVCGVVIRSVEIGMSRGC
jgi:hypothetical protein